MKFNATPKINISSIFRQASLFGLKCNANKAGTTIGSNTTGCFSCRQHSISVVLRRLIKPPLDLDTSWGVCSQSQRGGNQPLQAGDQIAARYSGFHAREKSSSFGFEDQLLEHSACEHGQEKSRHYRSRDLLYCGVSLRQPRPRLHPKNAHT